MSTLLRNLAAYLRTAPNKADYHIINRADTGSEETAFVPLEPGFKPARIVEGDGTMRRMPVGSPKETRLTHFLDGIERMHIPCYRSIVPMVYAFTAAVVRRRNDDKKMATWKWDSNESIYIPDAYFDTSDMASRLSITLVNQDDDPESKPIEPNPALMIERCRKRAQKDRERLEHSLLETWAREFGGSDDDWLLLDGSLPYAEERYSNVVGLIKSHQTTYFQAKDQIEILSLAAGERSSIFKVERRGGTPPLTWYLRLRPNDGRDVFFGLIRLEIADAPGALDMVDEISRWILSERQPLSLPDGRWDRLLYPIRDCEQFLRSIAPSRIMMEAAMMGI